MDNFNEWSFQQKLDTTLAEVKRILHTERHPVVAGDVHHAYSDKYCLAEWLTNTGLAATLNSLEAIGLDQEKLNILIDLAKKGNAVWLEASDGIQTCKFLRVEEREEKSKHKVVKDSSMFGKTTHQVVTKIKEYFYEVGIEYQIVARCIGQDPQHVVICSRKGKMEIKTTSEVAPLDAKVPMPLSKECPDVTFLLKELSTGGFAFKINRKEKCHTPMRNSEIETALAFFKNLMNFVSRISMSFYTLDKEWTHLLKETDREQPKVTLAASATSEKIFVPVIPIFEEDQKAGDTQERPSKIAKLSQEVSPVTFNLNDTNHLLHHQKETLIAKLESMNKIFPADSGDNPGLITSKEARIVVALQHCTDVCGQYLQSLYYIEHMIRKQLTTAIGKSLSHEDFDKYMRFHEKRVFASAFLPVPFSYAVRRPAHFPEGTISIEDDASGSPIFTMTRKVSSTEAVPMTFKINAATDITFNGDRYLHAFVATSFNPHNLTYTLSAHARQFSCFLLLLGRIGPENTFEPKHSILLQNKDDLKIPILLETLPTPKEFKDAIESLSPEQQRFAKAYRSMQLEGTVFGLLTIQLKPQLEKLLKLPADSLTKEIELTQDLLKLFIDYQIPSDLLSFDGDQEAEVKVKIDSVKGHVKSIMAMLDKTKKDQLEETATGFFQSKLETDSTPVMFGAPSPAAFSFGSAAGGMAEQHQQLEPVYMCLNASMVGQAKVQKPKIKCGPQRSSLKIPRTKGSVNQPEAVMDETHSMRDHSSQIQERSSEQNVGGKHSVTKDGVSDMDIDNTASASALDFTKVPSILDKQFEKLDTDSALKPTILNVGEEWQIKQYKSLLSKAEKKILDEEAQKGEKNRCFDLLDAMSCSGSLDIDCASLHVIVPATHCFEDTIINTIVKKNVNPIEKVERSTLIVASAIHKKPPADMVRASHLSVIQSHSPQLMIDDSGRPHEADE